MAFASAASLDRSLVPLIDLGPLRDGSAPLQVAQALHQASRDIGFIYVTNHGIDLAFLEQARTLALEFFRQPLDDKLRVAISPQHRGFLRIGADVVEVLLLYLAAPQRMRQGHHGLGERAAQEDFGVVQRDDVLVGLDERLGDAGARHGVGNRQHAVDRLGGAVHKTDVGGRLRGPRGDVV